MALLPHTIHSPYLSVQIGLIDRRRIRAVTRLTSDNDVEWRPAVGGAENAGHEIAGMKMPDMKWP